MFFRRRSPSKPQEPANRDHLHAIAPVTPERRAQILMASDAFWHGMTDGEMSDLADKINAKADETRRMQMRSACGGNNALQSNFILGRESHDTLEGV